MRIRKEFKINEQVTYCKQFILISTLLILFLFQTFIFNAVAFSKEFPKQSILAWQNLGNNIGCASLTVKVHNSVPSYLITIRGIINKENDYEDFTPKEFEIRNKSTGKVIQKINAFWVNTIGKSEDMIQIVDMNFDGYFDFRFLIDRGATGNNWYASYLYDPKTHKFILNKHLTSQSGIIVDAKNNQISTYERYGACREFMKYYKYQNGQYIFTKIEWTEMHSTNESSCFKTTGIPKVKDIEVNHVNMNNQKYSDYIRKRVKVVKEESISKSLLEGTGRGTFEP